MICRFTSKVSDFSLKGYTDAWRGKSSIIDEKYLSPFLPSTGHGTHRSAYSNYKGWIERIFSLNLWEIFLSFPSLHDSQKKLESFRPGKSRTPCLWLVWVIKDGLIWPYLRCQSSIFSFCFTDEVSNLTD